jgi:carbamoyl-phosphate synthase small subunit
MNGAIASELPADMGAFVQELKNYVIRDAVKSVSCSIKTFYQAENAEYHVVLYDYGYKASILHNLLQRGCSVTVVPYNTTAEEIREINPDGIVLSNGPGDPAENTEPIQILRELMMKTGIPIFGICLGHQLWRLRTAQRRKS